MFKFATFVALFSVANAHLYDAQQQSYAPSSYSYRQQSFNPQQSSNGLSNQLPYNLPGNFADSKLEQPIYYNAKQASYSYPQKTITVLPTLYIPPLPSFAPSANSYQSHHPADIQNVEAQPSAYYPSTASQSVLPSHNAGYSMGSNDLYNSNSSPSGSW